MRGGWVTPDWHYPVFSEVAHQPQVVRGSVIDIGNHLFGGDQHGFGVVCPIHIAQHGADEKPYICVARGVT